MHTKIQSDGVEGGEEEGRGWHEQYDVVPASPPLLLLSHLSPLSSSHAELFDKYQKRAYSRHGMTEMTPPCCCGCVQRSDS